MSSARVVLSFLSGKGLGAVVVDQLAVPTLEARAFGSNLIKSYFPHRRAQFKK